MMRKTLPFLFVSALITVLLAGCSSNMINSSAVPASGTVPVSISMTDDPPAGVSVLFFQVSLTDASLMPAMGSSVSLLNNNAPIQIDVTQLQALSAFLSTASVAPGTYKSLSLTFANPQLVIYNQSDASLGSTCAVGSICQLTPTIDNSATLSFTTSPFPVTVSSGSPLGLLVDFHLNTVIQSDLSVNLSATNGVSVSTLPPAAVAPHFGFLTGTVGTVSASANQFTLQTQWGRTFTIDTSSTTAFNNFPSSACTTASISCLAQGQIVQVQISGVDSNGQLNASQVTYVQQASAITVQGNIIQVNAVTSNTTGASPSYSIVMILHWNPTSASGFPLGGMAVVSLPSSVTYSIDANGFTMPTGLTFTGASNLAVGQNVTVTVVPGTVNNKGGSGPWSWGPPPSTSFTASAVELEPSQVTGMITGTDSTTTSFTLGVGGGPWFAPWPIAPTATFAFNVMTTSQTSFTGFNPDSFNGLASGDFVSVNGWLFPPSSSGTQPVIAAQSVVMRQNFWF